MTEQTAEVSTLLAEIKTGWEAIRFLPTEVEGIKNSATQLAAEVKEVRRTLASRGPAAGPRSRQQVSEETAARLGAVCVLHCARSGSIELLSSLPSQRDALISASREILGLSAKAALTTADIPLPDSYGGEIRELISEFGLARRRMSHYPIGMGTAKPARMGTRPAFGSIAMSAALPEVSPTLAFASLESHKVGGIVRVPRELDEQ